MNQNITISQSILRYAFGVSLIVIGLDKVFHTNIVTEWEKYVSPLALSVLPISAVTLVSVLGIAEIIVGALFFTRFCKIAAYIAIVTLAAIIVNLFSLGLYDIALRDALLALSAYVFTLLTTVTSKDAYRN
jgi:uncharacterized membrane protein YphA (DoxX/SURF4 family)